MAARTAIRALIVSCTLRILRLSPILLNLSFSFSRSLFAVDPAGLTPLKKARVWLYSAEMEFPPEGCGQVSS
jgi:hypothetical protein